MKKITLALVAVVCFFSSVHSQLNYTLVAPLNNNSTSSFRAPNGTSAHAYQRSVMYISAAELLPMSMSTINSFSFQYTNGTGSVPVTGNFTVYMQNTTDADYLKGTNFTTALTGMSTVYNSTYVVPGSAGASTVGVTLSSGFPYTGGGLYIAWDWMSTGPFAAATCTYACNNTKTQITTADGPTAAPNTLVGSNFRPSLLFSATNTSTNDIGVIDIKAEGKISKQFGVPQTISARVVNSSIGAQNNVSVSLNVGGANPFTNQVVIPTLPAGVTATINFASFPSPNSGINTISVTALFNDQNLTNNQRVWTQSVTCNEAGSVPPVAGSAFLTNNAYGNGTGAGAIYSTKFTPSASASITGVRMVVANIPANNVGFPITPILMDAAGVILASGNPVTTTSGMLGQWNTFNFTTPQALTGNTDYYIGASISSQAFYPFAILNNTYTPYFTSPGFFSSPLTGGTFAQVGIDYFGIEAALSFTGTSASVVASKTVVCKGDAPITLTASGLTTYTWTAGTSPTSIGTTTIIAVTPTVAGTGGGVAVFAVTGTAANGCKSSAATINVSVSICTGIAANNSNGFDLKLFPNPAVNGKTTISGLAGTNAITVFNMLGQAVLTQVVNEETVNIDLSSQPSGTYLVKITDSLNESRSVKIVNQN